VKTADKGDLQRVGGDTITVEDELQADVTQLPVDDVMV